MSKYKVGDKVVLTVTGTNEMGCYYVLNDRFNILEESIDKYAEPLSTYTEPLERKNENKQKQIEKLVDKLHRQAAEITRLLAENKELKEESKRNYTINIEMARAEGHSEAWELARKIVIQNGYSGYDLYEIFGSSDLQYVLENYTYPEAAAKVAEWEKGKEEIKVGDVFQDNDGNNAIVTSIKGNTVYYMWDDGDTRSGFAEDVKKHFTKTGRHIDIDGFLKQIGEE